MNDREAILTGLMLGILHEIVIDPESAFTYVDAEVVVGNFTNRVRVTAEDGATFLITVEQVP